MPLDTFVDAPVSRMQVVGDAAKMVPQFSAMQSLCSQVEAREIALQAVERFAFYEAAKRAFCIIRTSDQGPYGVSGFDAKRLAGIDTVTLVRGSDKRSPGGGTPDLIAGRRKAASKGVAALPLLVNRSAPVWLARPDLTRVKSSKKARVQRKGLAGDSVEPVTALKQFAFNLIRIDGRPLQGNCRAQGPSGITVRISRSNTGGSVRPRWI